MATTSSVSVALRIKPAAADCRMENGCLEVAESMDGQRALVTVRSKAGTLSEFAFDTVFMDSPAMPDPKGRSASAVLPNTQQDVFNRVARPLCRAVLQGMHASILAYGQTGSGKTYTILGPLDSDRQKNPEHCGLLPRCLSYLFKRLPQHMAVFSGDKLNRARLQHEVDQLEEKDDEDDGQKSDGSKILCWKMEVQFVEIYQERLFDLLAPPLQLQSSLQLQTLATGSVPTGISTNNNGNNSTSLAVRYDKHGKGAHVAGAVRKEVLCLEDALEAFHVGLRARRTSETKLNTSSSRSHAIFSVFLTQTKTEPMLDDDTKTVVTAQLHLVDLAGSERQKDTQAVGERLREAGKINSSLSILSQVVRELAEGGSSGGHVPYRDSKLTFLLMNSLGGTGKAAVIATLNQQHQHAAETRSTLAFAALSKSVRLRPVANQTLTLSHERLMTLMRERTEMAAELKRLKALVLADGGEPNEQIPPPHKATESSADLFQALIDATDAAEIAKAQLRAVLRSEPPPASKEGTVDKSTDGIVVPTEEHLQGNLEQMQHLMQLLLRHSMYSPQLLLQLRETGFKSETEGGADTFLRIQALLVRLLELQGHPIQNLSCVDTVLSNSQRLPHTSAAVAVVLASAFEKAVLLLKADVLLPKEQQGRHQEAADTGRLFSHEAPARQTDETKSTSDTSSTIVDIASGSGNAEDVLEIRSDIEEMGRHRSFWEPQILAASHLLESLAEAALLETVTWEQRLGGARTARGRLICANAVDEALQRLVALRGFNALSKKETGNENAGPVLQEIPSAGDSTLAESAPGESLQGRWCQEQHLDSRRSTLASREISSIDALEEVASSSPSPQNSSEGQVLASRTSDETSSSPMRQVVASHVRDAETATLAEKLIDALHDEGGSPSTCCNSEPNYGDLREQLEYERSRRRFLEERIVELESQRLRYFPPVETNASQIEQEKDVEQQMIQLPFVIPLSAICGGNQIVKGQLVFCVHAEAGDPASPGSPSYRGPCYISMWEEKEEEGGRRAPLLFDSVSFTLIKKVSRVLDNERPKGSNATFVAEQLAKPSEGSGAVDSEEEPNASRSTGVFAQSRFLYRLYFRQPVAFFLPPEVDDDNGEPTLISWITLAIDEAAVSSWDVNSPEECDKLLLHAMRRGAGKSHLPLSSRLPSSPSRKTLNSFNSLEKRQDDLPVV